MRTALDYNLIKGKTVWQNKGDYINGLKDVTVNVNQLTISS